MRLILVAPILLRTVMAGSVVRRMSRCDSFVERVHIHECSDMSLGKVYSVRFIVSLGRLGRGEIVLGVRTLGLGHRVLAALSQTSPE